MSNKNLLVLARNDHKEAMRVAAGMTIFGHSVDLIFMHHPVSESDAESDEAELLTLADIQPRTTVESMAEYFELLDTTALGQAVKAADGVINL